MGVLHFRHIGAPFSVGIELSIGRSTAGAALRPSRKSPSSPFPSINSIFRPAANSFASFVNVPDVTTYPPATRSAANSLNHVGSALGVENIVLAVPTVTDDAVHAFRMSHVALEGSAAALQWMAHQSFPLTDGRVYRVAIGGRTVGHPRRKDSGVRVLICVLPHPSVRGKNREDALNALIGSIVSRLKWMTSMSGSASYRFSFMKTRAR
jgi:hypothetical protein